MFSHMKFLCLLLQASPLCAGHVRRVMHQQASSVKLMPEIEQACMHDLGKDCDDRVKEGEVRIDTDTVP